MTISWTNACQLLLGFANVTNTFHACKRNAVHTSASKEQTLTNTFELFHCKQRKKKREARPLKLPGKLQSEAWSLGRWTGIDKRSHFLDRAEPMGGSAQRWTGLRVWEISLQRLTPRSPWLFAFPFHFRGWCTNSLANLCAQVHVYAGGGGGGRIRCYTGSINSGRHIQARRKQFFIGRVFMKHFLCNNLNEVVVAQRPREGFDFVPSYLKASL